MNPLRVFCVPDQRSSFMVKSHFPLWYNFNAPSFPTGASMKAEIEVKLSEHITHKILKQPNRILKPEQPLISSGLIDSFSLVDLALYVEDTFGVHIDDSELNVETFDTLDQLTSLIDSRSNPA
jgi:acyl carrier protein